MSSSSRLSVLVVDDEPLARRRLVELLEGRTDVADVMTADSGDGAMARIRERAPDLVFLDVQMAGKSGLDVVRDIGPDVMPATIFVTAYDKYTLNAFDLAATDYLLKPFDDERFERAFNRAKEIIHLRALDEMKDVAPLQREDPAPGEGEPANDYLERIAVEARGRIQVVSVDEIDYITADGPYLILHTPEQTHLIPERMKTLEERLDPASFFRIHRSTIVCLDRIEAMTRQSGGRYAVRLKDGTRLAVSRSRREGLEEWIAGG